MRKSNKIAIAVLSFFAAILGFCTFLGILLIPAEIAPPKQSVHENIEGIGYTKYPPSRGLLFLGEDGSGIFIFLDFSSISTYLYVFPEKAEENTALLPYVTDGVFNVKSDFLARFCDRLGGIEMTDETGEKSLYFSSSIMAFCEEDLTYNKILQLCLSFFEKISKTGLSSEDFMFIIEETQSDISFSVCYDWIPHIKEMFCNVIIN